MAFSLRAIPILLLFWFSSAVSADDKAANVIAHSITEQISEGLNLSAGAKAAVTKFFREHGRFPVGNAEAGLINPDDIRGKYVVSVTVATAHGEISAKYGGDASLEIYGRTIEWIPAVVEGKIEWSCSSQYIAELYWPQACQ